MPNCSPESTLIPNPLKKFAHVPMIPTIITTSSPVPHSPWRPHYSCHIFGNAPCPIVVYTCLLVCFCSSDLLLYWLGRVKWCLGPNIIGASRSFLRATTPLFSNGKTSVVKFPPTRAGSREVPGAMALQLAMFYVANNSVKKRFT